MRRPERILIVEDEPEIASVLSEYLVEAGMEADVIHDGADAVDLILSSKPDLVILDVMLPGKDGLTVCREVRAKSEVPIILETAKVEEIDRLLGLELGADDYICKPFSPREMVARVKAILRRYRRQMMPDAEPDTAPRLRLDADRWAASIDGISLDLTRREFQLLSVLHGRPGRVFSRGQLLDLAFHGESDVFDRTIDSHIKNIRQKIKKADPASNAIRSVYGVGYAYDG
jgi:two-component system, OmpR family, response regulator BaeR